MTHYLLVSPLPPPPISTLLPYTTPFRSPGRPSSGTPGDAEASRPLGQSRGDDAHEELTHLAGGQQGHQHRSEEHTSELQSRGHLVCRLLLEKKKKRNHTEDEH